MSNIWIVIVTENQNSIEQAELLALTLAADLGIKEKARFERYLKFPDSYKISLAKDVNPELDINIQCLQFATQIAQPWITNFYHSNQEIDLIFNKNASSRFSNPEYKVIKWMNAGINRTDSDYN